MFIMRGLPGSGKSTLSKKIADTFSNEYQQTPVCAGDDFFIDKASGEYKFNADLLSEAHTSAQNKATEACK
jgi:uridine kinase